MEGIHLISSTYSDDDEEDDQEPSAPVVVEHYSARHSVEIISNDDEFLLKEEEQVRYYKEENGVQVAPTSIDDSAPPPFGSRPVTPQQQQQPKVTIVDYGHDEVALSPEQLQEAPPEDREMLAAGSVAIENLHQTANGNEKIPLGAGQILSPDTQASSPLREQVDGSGSHAVNSGINERESTAVEQLDKDSVGGVDDSVLLARFLPPLPTAKSSNEFQERINKFLYLKRLGKNFNTEVRNKKEYRNPDFLLHAVTSFDIDEIGSGLPKSVFDPHGYDESDFYDAIEADMKREMERKEQEKKKSPKVEFVSGVVQSGAIGPSPKLNIPTPGLPSVNKSGVRPVSAAVDSMAREGRQNKKSKWDKVDGDQTSGAHAAASTAGNASSRFLAFEASQRRKEVEEKKYIERKDRRS